MCALGVKNDFNNGFELVDISIWRGRDGVYRRPPEAPFFASVPCDRCAGSIGLELLYFSKPVLIFFF